MHKITEMYNSKRKDVQHYLQTEPSERGYSITCGMWSNVKMQSFSTVTLHLVDSKWELKSVNLKTSLFETRHTLVRPQI